MSSHENQDPIVRVTTGAVRGRLAQGVRCFIGIPYAAPPVDDRRFASPAPPPPWTGVRDVTEPGANAPQRIKAVPGLNVEALIGHGWIAGDDCPSSTSGNPTTIAPDCRSWSSSTAAAS